MKKFSIFAASAAILILASCGKDLGTATDKDDAAFEAIAKTALEKTIYPTYSALADKTEALNEALAALKVSKTDANVKAAADIFLAARACWEQSEAFLYGAASDFGIDPHIDSWPLDEDAFNRLMQSPAMLSALEGEEGAVYAGENLGNALLGFHGIEFILFEGGQPKKAADVTDNHLVYAIAVSGDLRNRTAQLDAAWRGEAAGERLALVEEELELQTTVGGGESYYGENMLGAGKAGSTYRSWTHAMQAILQGCADIADEVGTSKIGKAYYGTTEEDVNYIESPYSYNSITDFYDNLTSIENIYYGGPAANRDEAHSLHSWFAKNHKDVDASITSSLDAALAAVKGMKFPFVNNIKDQSNLAAIEAIAALQEKLSEAITTIAQ